MILEVFLGVAIRQYPIGRVPDCTPLFPSTLRQHPLLPGARRIARLWSKASQAFVDRDGDAPTIIKPPEERLEVDHAEGLD
jgi:hypothetical protein